MDDYYVYEHWQPDAEMPFYVGKGRGKRAGDFVNRGARHRLLLGELRHVDVRIFAAGLTDTAARAVEVERIAYWRKRGASLVNVGHGGDGISGRIVSPETRAKISATNKLRWSDPEMRAAAAQRAADGWKATPDRPLSDAGRAAIVARHTGRVPTAEDLAKRSAKLTGRIFSDETRTRMSAAKKGKKQAPELIAARSAGMIGHVISPETRAKIGAANRASRAAKKAEPTD